MTKCAVCGKTDGSFERVTFVGAREGGVPVHIRCIQEFFRRLDATPFPNIRKMNGEVIK